MDSSGASASSASPASPSSPAAASEAPIDAAADATFLAARDAYRNADAARLERAFAALPANYPLRDWVDYWRLRLRLDNDDASVGADIGNFLAAHDGQYLAEKLRGDWLRELGRYADWPRFRQVFSGLTQADDELNCYAMQAGAAVADQAADAAPMSAAPTVLVSPLGLLTPWRTGKDLPAACDAVIAQLAATGELRAEDVWQRVRRLFRDGKVGAGVTAAAKWLPAGEGFGSRRLEIVAADPARYFSRLPADFAATRAGRETALMALRMLAKQDARLAAARLGEIEARLPAADRAYAWGQLAQRAAWQHLPEALDWFAKADPAQFDDDEQHAWHVRAALRARDWARVQQAIAAMPDSLREQPVWTYWQGRALAAQGKDEAARALYRRIAGQANFYGNLATEALGQRVSLPPPAAPPTAAESAAVRNDPALRRALTLLRLNLRTEGTREWIWRLRGADDRTLLAAAELARRNALWDRAINTADRTKTQHDFRLRYLAPFRDRVEPTLAELGLDASWVYGLMRQESRFVINANSSVGAQGLMQLMPATARWVAKKIRLADYHPGRIGELETNVQLGANYLKLVLDSLGDQPVLASAAYNAGPGRARRWRADTPLEGAIYVETIPFSETRDYVQKVMSNAMYYRLLFGGEAQPLTMRLGVIVPAGGEMADNLP